MLTKITYYQILGISFITYLGILALFLFTVTAIVTIRNRKGGRLLFNWHHRLAAIAIIVAFIHGILGLLGSDTIRDGVAGSVQDDDSRQSSFLSAGADIFNTYCRVCHPNGGNIINPDKPVKGSQKLRNFDTFLAYIRTGIAYAVLFTRSDV